MKIETEAQAMIQTIGTGMKIVIDPIQDQDETIGAKVMADMIVPDKHRETKVEEDTVSIEIALIQAGITDREVSVKDAGPKLQTELDLIDH